MSRVLDTELSIPWRRKALSLKPTFSKQGTFDVHIQTLLTLFFFRLLRNWQVPLAERGKCADRSESLRKMANYLAGTGNFEDALSLYNQSLQFAPGSNLALLRLCHFNRAVTLFFLEHYIESLCDLSRVENLDVADQESYHEKQVDVLFWKAKNYSKLKSFDKATRKV
jgi:tetratricopeptide (TPR) repeat protein